VLSLSSNNLTGDISSVLSELSSKIVAISLSDNRFKGVLGDSFCHLDNLGELVSYGQNC